MQGGNAKFNRVNPRLSPLFERVYREIRPRVPIPVFEVRFYRFSSINNTIRLREGVVRVRISDLLEGAPQPVLHAIAHILLAKLYGKAIDPREAARYRRHISSHDMRQKAHLIRNVRGNKRITSSKGRTYDLDEVFESLNGRFFFGLLGRPRLTWSGGHARQSLGHYDPAHNTIVISRIFDRPATPRFAIEYLLYHEMLHLKHPVKVRGNRRCIHSPEFQAEERLFPELDMAKEFLRTL